jgi:hypothetical protein
MAAAGGGGIPSADGRPKVIYFTFSDYPGVEIPFRDPYRSRLMSSGLQPEEGERIGLPDPTFTPEIVQEGVHLMDIFERLRDIREGRLIMQYHTLKRFILDLVPGGRTDFRQPFLEWLGPDLFDEVEKMHHELITDEDDESIRIVCERLKTLPGVLPKGLTPLHIICMKDQPPPRQVLDYAIDCKSMELLRWVAPMIGRDCKYHHTETIPLLLKARAIPDSDEVVEFLLMQPWLELRKAVKSLSDRFRQSRSGAAIDKMRRDLLVIRGLTLPADVIEVFPAFIVPPVPIVPVPFEEWEA